MVICLVLLPNKRDIERASEHVRVDDARDATAGCTSAVLDSIAVDDDVTLSVRKDALFFLAQGPNGEGIPALLRVAETSTSGTLRKDAIWILAQSRDSRALELFEKLLAGR